MRRGQDAGRGARRTRAASIDRIFCARRLRGARLPACIAGKPIALTLTRGRSCRAVWWELLNGRNRRLDV